MSEKGNEYTNLVELGGSKYEIVDGEANVKGWAVRNEHGVNIGVVDELLFDPETLSVRYLVVDLAREISGTADRRVLVPIGTANLEADAEIVVLPNVSSAQLSRLPEYEKGRLTTETEREIRHIFEGEPVRPSQTTNTLPVIEENLKIGKKQVETGRTSISSRIVERKVEGSIDLKKEHVEIERNPVNRPLRAEDGEAFKEQDFDIIEHTEVPVVSKEARVVEEITIRKDVEEHQEVIRETLRNTEVKAEHLDSGQKDASERI